MTRLQLRTLIRKRLGETTAAFWSDTEMNDWINDGCRDIAFRTKCIRDNDYLDTVADTAEYGLTTSFPGIASVLEVYYKLNGIYVRLEPTDRDELNISAPGWMSAASGSPYAYYWSREEDVIGFHVAPDSDNAGADYARVYFAKQHTDLTADGQSPTIPEYLHLAIVDFVAATGFGTRGWGDKENDMWTKYYSKLNDYSVERRREREDDELIMKSYRNI